MTDHRRRKQIRSVEAMLSAVPREAQLRKWKVISLRVARRRIFSKCAILDCKTKPSSTVYNNLASFSDLTNPPVQYPIYVENRLYWLRRRSRLAFVACLVENLHLLRTEPAHWQDFHHLIVYFNQKCTHVTAYETDATKRMLELSLAPRERG